MNDGSFLALAHNAALLLGLGLICDMITPRRPQARAPFRHAFMGVIVGTIGIVLILTPWKLEPGIVFDTRSVLLGISGLFLGVIPTVVAMVMIAAVRLAQGGAAAGVGVGVILASGIIGIAWRHVRRPPLTEISWKELYCLGLVVHLVMLGIMLGLPRDTAVRVLKSIALPVLVIFPLGTTALGMLLANRLRRRAVTSVLRESEERIRATLYGIGDGVVVTDALGQVTRINPMGEQLTGWGEADAVGKPLAEVFRIVSEETRNVVANPAERVIREGVVVGLANHTLLIARDGTDRPIADSAAPIRDEDGALTGVVLVFRDQTDDRMVRKALQESESRFRALFEQVGVGMGEIDSQTGQFLRVNQHYCDLVGYTEQEMLEATFQSMTHPDDLPTDLSNMERLRSGDIREFRMEKRYRRKDGALVWVTLSVAPLWSPGSQPSQHVAVVQDITSRKQAEASLAQAKDIAEQASRAKDEFMARLSHELRTPLTPVLLAMGQWQTQTDLPAGMQDDLTMMRRNLDLEARLLDDLLDVNRILHGKMPLRRSVIDMHQKIANSLEIVGADIQAKRLELTCRLEAAHSLIDGDPARVQQAVWNLLSNAIKFTPEGGRIGVSTDNDPEGYLHVRISDSGMGIDSELLPRLFRPFEQGGQQITRGYGGLGLGLTICKSVAEQHGGIIAAQSDGPGRGATFTLRFPTVRRPREVAGPGAVQTTGDSARGVKRQILLVEDHSDTARLLSRVLTSWGYKVRVAQSVASALESAAAAPFDLLISDLGLPDGSGHDLMRQLSARGPLKGIAVSGYGMEDDQQRSREVGFLTHLTKPVDLAELRTALSSALEPG